MKTATEDVAMGSLEGGGRRGVGVGMGMGMKKQLLGQNNGESWLFLCCF